MGHAMGTKQEHSALLGQLAELCATAVAEYESTLAQQEEANSAAAKRMEEEEKKRAEVARQAAEKEKEEKEEKEEKLKERERKREEVAAAECELAAQKRALLEVEKALDDSDDNDPDNDVRSQSFVAENNVSI